MFVRVSALDVFLGEARNPRTCPLALALRRKCKTSDVRVRGDRVYIAGKKRSVSRSGRKFQAHFDRGDQVKPGLYWI